MTEILGHSEVRRITRAQSDGLGWSAVCELTRSSWPSGALSVSLSIIVAAVRRDTDNERRRQVREVVRTLCYGGAETRGPSSTDPASVRTAA